LKPDGLSKLCLAIVEGPEDVGVEFERVGNVEVSRGLVPVTGTLASITPEWKAAVGKPLAARVRMYDHGQNPAESHRRHRQ